MFFKNRKSRKQLLKEIEELKSMRTVYLDRWMDKCDSYNSVLEQIITINASCIHSIHSCNEYDEAKNKAVIEDCLCKQLAKELLPYVSIEEYIYAPIDPHFHGEAKYIASIKIVADK